jgi:TonB family protein
MFLLRRFCSSLACVLSLTCPLTSHAADGQTLQIRPEFPPTLRLTHITEGYALVAWTVLPDGGLDDAIVLEASHAAFGQSALTAIPKQQVADPSGQLPRYEVLRISFKRAGVINSYTSAQAAALSIWDGSEQMRPPKLVHSNDMLAGLEQLGGAPPRYTEALRLQGTGATATVQYVIDEAGRVRVPRVLSASSIDFARTALAAIRKWRFAPPVIDGRQVIVEDLRTFSVGPTSEVAQLDSGRTLVHESEMASNREIQIGGHADDLAIQDRGSVEEGNRLGR